MPHFPFQRLQADLADLIARSAPGTRLPSEPELAKKLGVSRATLREAMRAFETQGLIRRRQGAGTFVVGQPPVIESGLEVLESMLTLARRSGKDV
ncbi:MAG: GntR family transcriptional regulator, partial [Anaerolineales bacterium]